MHSVRRLRHDRGLVANVIVSEGVLAGAAAVSRKKLRSFVVSPNREDLLVLKELIEAGKARPVIERRYPLSEVPEALRHIGEGHAQGQTVIRVAG